MKKLLSILASVGMVATASTAVVSCGIIKKSVTVPKTDLIAKDKYEAIITSAYDYKKANDKKVAKIKNAILKKEKSEAKKADKDADKYIDSAYPTDQRVNLSGASEDWQEDAGNMVVMVTKYHDDETANKAKQQAQAHLDKANNKLTDDTKNHAGDDTINTDKSAVKGAEDLLKSVNKTDFNMYRINDPKDILDKIETKSSAVENITFISVIHLLDVIKNTNINTNGDKNDPQPLVNTKKNAPSGWENTDANDQYKQGDETKKNNEELDIDDFVNIMRADKNTFNTGFNDKLLGDFNTNIAVKNSQITDEDSKDSLAINVPDEYSQAFMNEIFKAGDHQIQLTITISDNAQPQIDANVVKKYAE